MGAHSLAPAPCSSALRVTASGHPLNTLHRDRVQGRSCSVQTPTVFPGPPGTEPGLLAELMCHLPESWGHWCRILFVLCHKRKSRGSNEPSGQSCNCEAHSPGDFPKVVSGQPVRRRDRKLLSGPQWPSHGSGAGKGRQWASSCGNHGTINNIH